MVQTANTKALDPPVIDDPNLLSGNGKLGWEICLEFRGIPPLI
jgi:hypothetical protein